MIDAPRAGARIMRPSDQADAPNEVWVEFSIWPDGTVEIEDFSADAEAPKPHWVKYVREKPNSTKEQDQ